jgi:hypothetical protein
MSNLGQAITFADNLCRQRAGVWRGRAAAVAVPGGDSLGHHRGGWQVPAARPNVVSAGAALDLKGYRQCPLKTVSCKAHSLR